jgi:hypothetical protein
MPGSRVRVLALAVALSFALIATTACNKKVVGAPCRPSQSTCIDVTNALVCRNGVYVQTSCGGPLGCQTNGDGATCDATVAEEGAICVDDRAYACSPDKQRALSCDSGKMREYQACRGPGGCSVAGGGLSCDATHAADGDRCIKPESEACSPDGKAMLECKDIGHTWKVIRMCRGSAGCTIDHDVATCDESRSEVGDPCSTYGRVACSVDGSRELVCMGGRFEHSRNCPNAGCSISGSGRAIKCR